MAYRYHEDVFATGDYVTPNEFNTEVNVIAGEINGRLDRDNLGAAIIGESRIYPNALHKITLKTGTVTQAETLNPNKGWVVVDNMDFEHTTYDGPVHFRFQANLDLTAAPANTAMALIIGIRINGDTLIRSENVGGVYFNGISPAPGPKELTYDCSGQVNLPAGTHRIQGVVRAYIQSSVNVTLDILERRMLIEEGRS